ncbi:MAG: hypothetical protein WCF33_00470 [Pseudonocardiaceae bacterium]
MTNDISANGAARQSRDDGDEDQLLRARVHLLAADGLLAEEDSYLPREYFTLCAQVLTGRDLPHATCPNDECDCELRYCPSCIQHAIEWNAEIEEDMQGPGWTARVSSAQETDAPSGVTATRL